MALTTGILFRCIVSAMYTQKEGDLGDIDVFGDIGETIEITCEPPDVIYRTKDMRFILDGLAFPKSRFQQVNYNELRSFLMRNFVFTLSLAFRTQTKQPLH